MMYLFVYGTLKNGYRNHYIIKDAEFIGHFRIPGFNMYSLGGFPGVVPGEGSICGELYKITEDHIPRLDRLEGVNHKHPLDGMYRREQARLISEVGTWDYSIYVYNGDVSDRRFIYGGDWNG